MKKMACLLLSLLLCLSLFAGCSGKAGDKGELVLYTWEGMFPQEVLDGFEEETGISINYANFDYDETMLAKLEGIRSGAGRRLHHRNGDTGGPGPEAGQRKAFQLGQHQPPVPGAVL